ADRATHRRSRRMGRGRRDRGGGRGWKASRVILMIGTSKVSEDASVPSERGLWCCRASSAAGVGLVSFEGDSGCWSSPEVGTDIERCWVSRMSHVPTSGAGKDGGLEMGGYGGVGGRLGAESERELGSVSFIWMSRPLTTRRGR